MTLGKSRSFDDLEKTMVITIAPNIFLFTRHVGCEALTLCVVHAKLVRLIGDEYHEQDTYHDNIQQAGV